jgi:hypothetical protein
MAECLDRVDGVQLVHDDRLALLALALAVVVGVQ